MSEFYESPRIYIQSSSDIAEKICRIDLIIEATEGAMLDAAAGEDTKEYRLDDGQTKINVQTRSVEEMTASIMKLLQLKEYYVNKYNGHSFRLVDHESTRRLTS